MSFSVKSLFGVFALMTSTLNENGNNLLFYSTHCNDIELYPYHYEFHLNRKKVIDFRIVDYEYVYNIFCKCMIRKILLT